MTRKIVVKTPFNDLRVIVGKSIQLYPRALDQVFLVIFLLLLTQELVSTVLLGSSFAAQLLSPLWASMLGSFVLFLCSIFLLGYLLSAIYFQIKGQPGDRGTHLRYAAKNFLRLVSVALVQSLAIFMSVAFYVILSAMAGLEESASQGVVMGFFLLIACVAYIFVSQLPPIALFQQMSIWKALSLGVKTVKENFLLVSLVMFFNIVILMLPGFLVFSLVSEVFGEGATGIQQVVHIFLSTLLMPLIQLILMHLYIFLFEQPSVSYQNL